MRLVVFYAFLLGLIPCIFINPYVGVLLYCWVSFMSLQRLVWGFPETIPLALVTAVMTVLGWLISSEPKRLRFDATVGLIIAFGIDISFTTIMALDPEVAVPQWDPVIKELIFVLITIALTTNRIRFHALLWVMAVAIGFYGLKGGVFAILTGGNYRIFGPAATVIADNNDIAAGLVVALPLMNYVRMNSAQRWVRIGWAVVMATSAVAIVSTYSRAGFLGLVVCGIFLLGRSRQKLIVGLAIGLLGVAAIGFMPEQYFARLDTITNYQQDESAMSRFQIWGAALKIATARPLTGAGFRATESPEIVNLYDPGATARNEHNVYIGVLADHGFIGLLLWAALALVGWRNSRWLIRQSRDRPEWRWANDFARMSQVSIVAYFVVGSFGNYEYWDYYFTLIGLLAAARRLMERAAVPKRVTAASPVPQGALSGGTVTSS